MRKQKRLKRKSLETERIKAQHGLEDSTDIIIVEHPDTFSVIIQAAGQIVRFFCSHYFCRVLPAWACVRMFPGTAQRNGEDRDRTDHTAAGVSSVSECNFLEVDYGKTSSDFELIKGNGCGS